MTAADVSLLDCPYWVPATSLSPAFAPMYETYVTRGRDSCGGAFLRSLGTRASDLYVGLATVDEVSVASPTTTATTTSVDGSSSSSASPRRLPYMMAMPLCIPRSACDGDNNDSGDDGDNNTATASVGMLAMLSDLLTSYHILIAQLPQPLASVSVSLQCRVCAPLLCGGRYLAVSTLDKLGQRIVYCTVHILTAQPTRTHNNSNEGGSDDVATAVARAHTLADVRALMSACTTMATVTHIKSNIIPSANKEQQQQRVVTTATEAQQS